VPDKRLGQVGKAFVVFVGALPPNSTGKVMKDQMR
jgi:hypothetical protein